MSHFKMVASRQGAGPRGPVGALDLALLGKGKGGQPAAGGRAEGMAATRRAGILSATRL
jgi:hypothetical protein